MRATRDIKFQVSKPDSSISSGRTVSPGGSLESRRMVSLLGYREAPRLPGEEGGGVLFVFRHIPGCAMLAIWVTSMFLVRTTLTNYDQIWLCTT